MKRLSLALTLTAAVLTVGLSGVASGAPGAAAPLPIRACPNTLDGFLAADNVDAYSTGTTNVTYFFDSLVDQNPESGVPGLIAYCVYTDGVVTDADATPASWKASHNGGNISFARGGGNKTNVPLDGTTGVEIGTATFQSAATSQDILLHIADAQTCQTLYGGTDVTTCFVLPKAGPVCNAGAGNTEAAYNAIPTDVEHCSPPSLGFEAQQTNEFGDEVTLDTNNGANTELLSMTVDFQSYGCSTSGHWNTGDCVTANFGTDVFTIPASGGDPAGITARIYDPLDLTTPLAESTDTSPIPYRPSADPVNCIGADAGKWFDPISQSCNNSLSWPVTFTFPSGITLPSTVVWTVKFNTSTEGYHPIVATIGTQPCNATAQGCGYDSLNVGTLSYPNAPYAGVDVDENAAFRSFQGNGDVLASETGWTGYRPLGEIVLGP